MAQALPLVLAVQLVCPAVHGTAVRYAAEKRDLF
jgi:hypothetical protein